jgi:Holliday junction resolvase RusA-like endonuclease
VTAIKSKAYREWIEKAGEMIQSQNPGKIEGGYGLNIKVPRKCRIDLDNVPKAINDLAQAHGIIGNDRQCMKLTVERGSSDETEVMFIATMGE